MRTLTTVLALIGSLVMAASGLIKVLSSGFREEQNELYQLADNALTPTFYLAVGVLELVIAFLLVIPRTRTWGGLGLLLVMVGAAGFNTTLAVDVAQGETDPASFVPVNVVLGALGAVIAGGWSLVRRKDRKSAAVTPAPAAA